MYVTRARICFNLRSKGEKNVKMKKMFLLRRAKDQQEIKKRIIFIFTAKQYILLIFGSLQ